MTAKDLREWSVPLRAFPWVSFAAGLYRSWRNDRTIRLGAGLAYYGLFSLASVLTLSLWIVRLVTHSADTEEVIRGRLEEVFGAIGPDVAQTVAENIEGAGGSLGLIGVGSLLVSGSLFFMALEDALNQIWDVPVRAGVRVSVRRRLVSLAILLAASLVIVAAVMAQTIMTWLAGVLLGSSDESAPLALLTHLGSWLLLATVLTALYGFLPATTVDRRAAVISGAATAAMIVVGTAAIGWYLRTFGVASISGAASSLLAVLVWIFYEAQILLAGAQLSKALDRSRRATGGVDRAPPEGVRAQSDGAS
ncbi:MAG: YihY/virulence factor BrkB family protein [Actinomycetota bacterium]|nr:YihY/virulence factor BrkB family protein [Actinomycetota bacterium]